MHQERQKQNFAAIVLSTACVKLQAQGMAEGTIGTIATLVGGLAGIAILAVLANSV